MSYNLTNKLALITGGGSGLGYAMAKIILRQHGEVVITGRTEEKLKQASLELGDKCHYFVNDIADLKEIPELVNNVEQKFGPIHTLINNAGIHLKKNFFDVTDAEFENVIKINQTAVFSLSREVARKMKDRNTGSIILISSMAAQYGIPHVIAYSAAKSAVEGMTHTLAVELSPFGIRVNCIAPGFIQTPMSEKALSADKERKNKVLSRTPLGKLGEPDDIGWAAAFLASDASKFITGAIIPVDGGNSIGF